jgi:hypothetical protein
VAGALVSPTVRELLFVGSSTACAITIAEYQGYFAIARSAHCSLVFSFSASPGMRWADARPV